MLPALFLNFWQIKTLLKLLVNKMLNNNSAIY
jgi:hypothetical protein